MKAEPALAEGAEEAVQGQSIPALTVALGGARVAEFVAREMPSVLEQVSREQVRRKAASKAVIAPPLIASEADIADITERVTRVLKAVA